MDTSQIIHEITDTFMQLAAIPHPSGQEQALSTHLANLLRRWTTTGTSAVTSLPQPVWTPPLWCVSRDIRIWSM